MSKHRYGFVCALVALLSASGLITEAQTGDPSTLPLIQFADLSYAGAFRLPREFTNGESFTHGGTPIAFNPYRNSLFVGSRKGKVAEVAVPGLISSSNITQLNFATYLQGFYEPTEGTISQITGSEASITGLMVMGDRLYGTATIYYDANNIQRVSHYARSTVLSSTSTIGMKQVWTDAHSGFVSGYMATVPAEWRQKLGGPAATGQCCIPIAWRTSWGPSAFAFNPPDLLSAATVPATPLLYYSDAHPTLGPWQGNNPVYSATTEITGMALIAGTRTALYFGRTGTGPFCYGDGTDNASLVGQPTPDGLGIYCYDPTNASKAQHGYPYNYQIWAYDMNDFAAVKAGTKSPWDVRPYAVWPFTLPHNSSQIRIGGIGYDPSRQIIYISQLYADQDTYEYRPIIHALKVGGGAVGAPMPPPDTTPLPIVTTTSGASATGTRLTALALAANKTAPQPAGTTITFTATPTGGTAPHQYKWFVHSGLQWIEMAGWSTSHTFNWTPAAANSQHRVGVWVRSAGNVADVAEFTQSVDFAIANSAGWTAPYEAAKSVSIAADKAAPQAAGSMITWSAAAGGGTAPYQYKWLVHNGLQWNAVSDWSTSSTFVWTPAVGNSGYRVGVWARGNGGTADVAEASNSADFAITSVSGGTAPPPSPTAPARLTAVSLTANKAAPQPAATTITFSAAPTGGAAPHQYKFLVHNGLSWTAMTGWSTSSTFDWTPASSNAGYRVGVWVRSAGLTADTPEVTMSVDFAITAAAAAPAPPPPSTTTAAQLTAVAMTPNKAAPQPAGTTITFSAVPNGGAAPQQYKWLVHNGLTWNTVTGWSTANTFNWTPASANSGYRVGVWVKSAGITADTPQVTMSVDFPITAAPAAAPAPPPPSTGTAPLTAVVISADRIAPQPAGTTIVFAATPNGGAAPQQYKWLIHNGLSWSAVTGWSTTSTFSWTPPSANAGYRVGVWVKSAGNTTDSPEVTHSIDFAISAAAVAPPPPTSTTPSRLTDVTLTANKAAPQIAGTTITFTAVPTGGATPHQYKWLIHNGLSWTTATGWSTTNTFTWTPPSANSSYRVGVWVRTAGNTADVAEFTMSMDFSIR